MCNEKFASFDDFAEACEKADCECAIDWDNLDATFYNFDFGMDYRTDFCKKSLNGSEDFNKMAKHQVKVQQEFRNCMSMFF
jgi:hypothetical protein